MTDTCETVAKGDSFIALFDKYKAQNGCDCIIVDEAQFCTAEQVNELKYLTRRVPVL